MNTYVLGDLQGCFDEFRSLLDAVRFDPGSDQLWLVGDLINRGPHSLDTLRLVKSLGESCIAVLGNHDLSVLAQLRSSRPPAKVGKTARRLADAEDGAELLDWLQTRPLAHFEHGYLMIHAGLPPQWHAEQALAMAAEVETVLRGRQAAEFLAHMYGDKPQQWHASLQGYSRLRFITNCLTRLRYCHADGRLALGEKLSPEQSNKGLVPWFALPGRQSRSQPILFGHWSTLGQIYWPKYRVWGLDTGCVWGGRLTALNLQTQRLIQAPSSGYKKPGAA